MVEMAMLLPVLMLIFLGAWTAANLIDDNDAAAQATRAGARLAAELGNGASSSRPDARRRSTATSSTRCCRSSSRS